MHGIRKKVFLTPSRKHLNRNLRAVQVASGCHNGRLVSIFRELSNLFDRDDIITKHRISFCQIHRNGFPVYRVDVDLLKFFLRPIFCRVFAIGQASNTVIIPGLFEKLGAGAFTVKNQKKTVKRRVGSKLFSAGLVGNILFQAWNNICSEHFKHAWINLFFDHKKGFPCGITYPVETNSAQTQPLAGDIPARQFILSTIYFHMPVNVKEAGCVWIFFHPVTGQFTRPFLSGTVPRQCSHFLSQTSGFRNTIKADEFAKLARSDLP